MNPYPPTVEQQMKQFYHSLSEKDRRRYAAIEAVKLGWGGITYISQLLECDYDTIRFGIEELDDPSAMSFKGIRRSGGGRKSVWEKIKGLDKAFLRVIANYTAGSPMNQKVKWTNLTRVEIAQLLKEDVLDRVYQTGRKVTEDFKQTMKIVFDDYLPQWNYTAQPQGG